RRAGASGSGSGVGAYFQDPRAASGIHRAARGHRRRRARWESSGMDLREKSLRRALAAGQGDRAGRTRYLHQPDNVGGEFGGKGDACDLPVAYFLARQCGRPVKIVMSYTEDLAASNPAHPAVVTVKSGVTRDGRIVARTFKSVYAGGAYGALKANAALASWHYAGGPYRVDNAEIEFLQVYTNTVPGGYYRSPGSIATVFALESHTDLIARELGIEPAEFRLKNLV